MTSTTPCKNYYSIERKCKFGGKCKFSHDDKICAKTQCPNIETCENESCMYNHEINKSIDYHGCEVKATGILIWKKTERGTEFLMVKEKEYFSDPGGKINKFDTSILEAARYEFQEETRCEFDQVITSQTYIPNAKYMLYFSEVGKDFVFEGNAEFIVFANFPSRSSNIPPLNPRLHGLLGFPPIVK